MKKMFAMILTLTLAATMLLCGCTGKSAVTGIMGEVIPIPVANEFRNDSNFLGDPDAVTIRPRHVYWEGDTLVAECFVINNKSTTVYNITVEKLAFGNEANGIFAEGAFGIMEGASIAPYTYITWTFHFSADAISTQNADLTGGLRTQFNTAYNH